MSGRAQPVDGLSALVYEAILTEGPRSAAQLAARLKVPVGQLHGAVEVLVAQGLMVSSGERGDEVLRPLPPRPALVGLARELEEAAESTRLLGAEWERLWNTHAVPQPYVEVVTGEEEIDRLVVNVLDTLRERVRSLQVGPIGSVARRPATVVQPGTREVLARGISIQAVYDAAVFEDPVALAAVEACVVMGEEVRVFAEIPLRLTLADDHLGLVVVEGSGGARRHALVVHPSGLLDSLHALFACFWRMSAPVTASRPGDPLTGEVPDDDIRQLLLYLSAGLTDEAIARALGISERTVGRRMARLQERLGVRSRFQLAAHATRRGWI